MAAENNNKLRLLWNEIENRSHTFEMAMNSELRRNTGSYYTSLELATYMIDELFDNHEEELLNNITGKRFLEPCVGIGNFVFSFLFKLYKIGMTNTDIQPILNNIYVCDTNEGALQIYKELFTKVVNSLWEITVDEIYFNEHTGKSGLLYDVTELNPTYIELNEVFPKRIVKKGFDIVVTNPPYKNLKAEKNKFLAADHYEIEKEKYRAISADVKKKFLYAKDGVPNLYKLFIEKIITEYTNQNAHISLLVPSTILSDKTCEKLRTYILENHKLSHIKMIKENNPYINAQQSLSTMLIKKNKPTQHVKIVADFCENRTQHTKLLIEDILNESTGNAIFSLPPKEYEILKKMRHFPTVKDLPFIMNMRGELDLTANSQYISTSKTNYPLLRGKNIGYFYLSSDTNEYADDSFVDKTNKKGYIHQPRIACQQVVNIHKERRITFSYIDSDYVLANSCNFISVEKNEYGIDLYALLGLFNSPIINWFFKLTSTNNHVNNYEIDAFPIPVESPYLTKIGQLTKQYLKTLDSQLLDEIYNLSYACYGITDDNDPDIEDEGDFSPLYLSLKELLPEINLHRTKQLLNGELSLDTVLIDLEKNIDNFTKKTCENLIKKYQKLKKGEILNHTTFKLSELDMEMVRSVPQGGNWKNIPMETVQKSQRLLKITKTGGRTTLYGRIDYTKPSYTITTYFNRPGNGTYIHPIHDRVLSVREAARFQSFKEDYYFYGNQSQILKQVGNAVPPLLAYQIASKIVQHVGCTTSIDLFCGAGGMTSGFREAGIDSVLCNDIEESACITLKMNNPEIDVFCGDITHQESKDAIVKQALAHHVDIICGGPPCQGFSMAGYRLIDDPRNKLFKEFVEIVSKVKPKVVVFENVEGFLSFQKGAVYESVLELFSELGYFTEGRKLMASDYAVPQKRKRVFIICTRKDTGILPAQLFPEKLTESPEQQVTAFDAIGDLENINCAENAQYDAAIESNYVKMLKGKMSFKEYCDLFSDRKSTDSTAKLNETETPTFQFC